MILSFFLLLVFFVFRRVRGKVDTLRSVSKSIQTSYFSENLQKTKMVSAGVHCSGMNTILETVLQIPLLNHILTLGFH